MGSFKYENIYDWNHPVRSDDPRELSKRYRIYEGQMLNIICQVSKCSTFLRLHCTYYQGNCLTVRVTHPPVFCIHSVTALVMSITHFI